MRIAACLLLYSLAVILVAPRVLTRVTRSGRTPRLGLLAWGAAIGSVLVSWVAAPVFLLMDFLEPESEGARLARACLAMLGAVLGGRYGIAVQAAVAALAVLMATRLCWHLMHALRAGRFRGRRHAEAARIVGRRIPGIDAIVLDAPERAAYCVPGRPHTIVVTSGAVSALTNGQLAAVLEHEHAHLRGHHHLLLTLTRGLRRAFPRVRLFTAGAAEVARLVEMCADDVAAHKCGRAVVVEALLAMVGPIDLPAGALAASGPTALARAERLLAPAQPARHALTRLVLMAAALALLVGPLAAVGLSAAGYDLCAPPPV